MANPKKAQQCIETVEISIINSAGKDLLDALGMSFQRPAENCPDHVTRIMAELDHAAEAAAWEPRVYNAVVRAKQIIQCQQTSINNFKVKSQRADQHMHQLETENGIQRGRIEHLEQYKAGIISIVNACNETYPNDSFSEDDVLSIVDLIKVDDLPFGAEEDTEELAEARELIEVQNRQLDEWEKAHREKTALLQQAKEKEQKLEKCLAMALAFMKGDVADVSFVDWLENTADSLTEKERNK